MAFYRSIRKRRSRRRIKSSFELQLTSMMDVLVIIVVFLLKSYSTNISSFTTIPGLKLPYSLSADLPPESIQIIITPESITLENEKLLEFIQSSTEIGSNEGQYSFKNSDLDEGKLRIIPLFDALIRSKNRSDILRAKSVKRDQDGNPLPFEGVIAIQADKRIEYDTIRKIMYTSAAAGYKIFRFLAVKKE